MNREPPKPPRPDLVRRPTGAFGWLDARLLRDDWLSRLGAEACTVLAFLALAADHQGASWWGRDRMARALSIPRPALDRALKRLVELQLVAHRPWNPKHVDGVWQLLPVPTPRLTRTNSLTDLATIVRQLGFKP